MKFTKILCPIDFSPCAAEALQAASQLSVDFHAPLVLVHVWEPPTYSFASEAPFPGDLLQGLMDDAEHELVRAKAEAERLGAEQVTTALLRGPAWQQITSALEQDPAIDLVVIGTHGRTGIQHVLMGSVAERVVRHAPCAVLVVRARA